MSDQSRNRNEEKHGQGGAGKRLEKKASQSLSPQEARKQKERLIMIAMLVLAAVMSVAAAVVVLYSRWVKKPVLPPPRARALGAGGVRRAAGSQRRAHPGL